MKLFICIKRITSGMRMPSSPNLFKRCSFLNRNFKTEILANFEFWGYQICQHTVHKITKFHYYFQLKSKLEGKTGYFLARN